MYSDLTASHPPTRYQVTLALLSSESRISHVGPSISQSSDGGDLAGGGGGLRALTLTYPDFFE